MSEDLPLTTSATRTESTTVKTTVGADSPGEVQAVVVVTQSKIAMINQAQASACAVAFTLTLCLGFLKPIFLGGEPLITAGELIGVAGGVITGAALANRSVPTRATDIVRPPPPPSTP